MDLRIETTCLQRPLFLTLRVGRFWQVLLPLRLQGRRLDCRFRHMRQNLSWQWLIHNWSDAELRFALQAITNTAPTAINFCLWGVSEVDPACILCGKPATLRHGLNGCADWQCTSPRRNTWRHNSVLSALRHRGLAKISCQTSRIQWLL